MLEATEQTNLQSVVKTMLQNYFDKLAGESIRDLYDLFLSEIEEPLFKAVLEQTHYNQSQAAQILGLSRGTLRKKLKKYDLI